MIALPFVVLVTTFKELDTADLRQCQLVSKLWNQASLEELYSTITIDTEEKSRLYVRTIKRSPQLGKYLETIDIKDLVQKEIENLFENLVWDRYGLLNTVINHCSNLLKIKHQTSSSPFWTKLMYAASQGRLPRLQYISKPWELGDYDYYVYTALAFKNTLKTLDIPDFEAQNLFDSEAYPILRNSLTQFPCLENLSVSYKSQQPLSHYNALIDDCKHLKYLSILPSKCDEEIQDIELPEINPHPNILELKCKWEFIKEDSQLNYVMKKFPNLKSLTVFCKDRDTSYFARASPEVLIKFLHFATSIEYLYLNLVLEEEECIKVWADIINEKYKNIELTISLSLPGQYDLPVSSVNFNKQSHRLGLEFKPDEDFVTLYTKFLTESGGNVGRLFLRRYVGFEIPEVKIHYSMIDIIRAIELCPSLQHFELEYVHDLPFQDCITYRHYEVKSLILAPVKNVSSIGTLKNMSFIFPNLKEMEFDSGSVNYGKSGTTNIAMPNTSLDILIWTFTNVEYSFDMFVALIRLNTISGERYYVALEDNKLKSISSEDYDCLQVINMVYLDITLQNLGKLEINDFTYTF